MYKYLGIGLLGLFAIMVLPAQGQAVPEGYTMYGMGTFVVHDAYGNEILRHVVHNVVVNDGENYIIDQVFNEGTTPATTGNIGSMCITGIAAFSPTDTTTAATLDADGTISAATRCKNVTFNDGGDGSVTNTATQFTTTDAGTNVAITGIGICQDNAATFVNCDFTGGGVNFLFAAVALSPTVTLQTGETVDIDYTFSIT